MQYKVICYKDNREMVRSGNMIFSRAQKIAKVFFMSWKYDYIIISDGKREISKYTTYHTIFNS